MVASKFSVVVLPAQQPGSSWVQWRAAALRNRSSEPYSVERGREETPGEAAVPYSGMAMQDQGDDSFNLALAWPADDLREDRESSSSEPSFDTTGALESVVASAHQSSGDSGGILTRISSLGHRVDELAAIVSDLRWVVSDRLSATESALGRATQTWIRAIEDLLKSQMEVLGQDLDDALASRQLDSDSQLSALHAAVGAVACSVGELHATVSQLADPERSPFATGHLADAVTQLERSVADQLTRHSDQQAVPVAVDLPPEWLKRQAALVEEVAALRNEVALLRRRVPIRVPGAAGRLDDGDVRRVSEQVVRQLTEIFEFVTEPEPAPEPSPQRTRSRSERGGRRGERAESYEGPPRA